MKKTINILVVDDDANLRKTLGDILKVKGYAVVSAENGAAALAEAQRAAVNIALIDLMLPDMSGIAVMEQIKTGSPYTEAIILTGHASLTTAIEATTKGAFSYLLKPYEIENLLLHIRHAIDRQQAQEEIRRLASFPRLNPQPVIELAPSGEVTYANPAADRLFPELRLLNGQHPLLIGLGDVYATFRQGGQTEMMREVVIGEASYEKHLYYVPESGLVRITVLDITERKRAEETLRKLSQAVEQSPGAIVITDLDANIEYVNEGFVKVTGYSRAEIIGQNPRLLHSGKTPRASYQEMWACLNRGEMWKGEFINRRKDGSEYTEAVLISPVRMADGRMTHYLAIKEDITERKLADEALRKANVELSLFRRLLDNSSDAIEVLDPITLRFLDVNEKACRDLGYSREELLSMSIFDIDPSFTNDARKMIDEQLQKSGTARFEGIHRRKDGSTFAVEVSIASANLDKPYGLCVVRDITARKQAEAAVLQLNEELENKVAARTADLKHAMIEAEQANRAKSDFLVNMSHEIRTPMNGVIGMIDVLKQSGLNDRQAEMANIIHDSAFALLTVIDDILDFSRIEAGKLQIGAAPMAIASVVDRVCATLDTLAEKNAVELTLTTDPAIPAQVLGDSGRLRQILLNLVNNAIKFSGGQQRQGKVSVRAMLVESNTARVTLEFRVTDNGIGMDAATQARLFDAFTQADTSTTRNFGGAGLGLAISGQLVNIMGGEIRVQSEPGIGSTFTVRLPFALPPALSDAGTIYTAVGGAKVYGRKVAHDRKGMTNNANATPAPLSREETHQLGNLILIAEDNEINQKVILQQLKLLGQTADIASNGREALERWRGGGYSFLFTDLHMPEMDGYELTAAIRTAEAGKTHMPIIAITANALRGEDEHCRAAGMDDYLSKPVQLVNLKAMLEKWLPVAGESAPDFHPPLQGEGWGGDGLNPINPLERHTPIPPPTPPLKGGENAAAASVPVEVGVLKALVGDDPAVIREFLHDFRVSAAKIATELKTACENRQAVQAGALAHKLKSSARSMGALALGELCAAMEQAGKSGDTKELEVLLPRFGAEMAAVDEYLGSLPA